MGWKALGGLAAAVLGLLFAVQNAAVVEIRFLFWSLAVSRAVLVVLLLAVGFLVGWIAHGLFSRRKA
ncbi:DUF1049 domain-containing protein [Dissulfurirhabdus thermomarina]|uniref:DUF1049 domain-containing protein n=1 Tax=Dissulfurirhabdus thermomarina TaxID=1765737 RepID=A0A6N9TS05_DISTH|nr:lipopolysaccharide assembly protein LapA domain-containing protein [Dissulfurirhabdus thermomarina]NDY41356.1 DUF1049 domain-containing protein [Dissulfurirhabdus thermomarina]NMX23261.1 DUF1049 domain-containing protein [Dissulfurirhabdus thermomarina]